MTERRWNPTLGEWVSTASHRQGRPQMPKDWCPFCPGSGRVPDEYDVLIYPNDFAAFSIPPPEPTIKSDGFYKVRPSHGKCDVVLYHPNHRTSLAQLPIDHIAKVAGVDHVGIGSDFDGISGQLPEGIDSAADLPKITEALMARGYTAEDCRKILGGNLLRVFREVEQVARELQAQNRPRISEKQPFDKVQK